MVVRHLKERLHLRLVFRLYPQSDVSAILSLFSLIKYRDGSHAGDSEDKKSVMGCYYFFNRAIVFWYNKKQRIVPILITEAKYISLRHAIREAIKLKPFLNELQVVAQLINSMTLYDNNENSILLRKNTKSQYHIKYFDMEYHYI